MLKLTDRITAIIDGGPPEPEPRKRLAPQRVKLAQAGPQPAKKPRKFKAPAKIGAKQEAPASRLSAPLSPGDRDVFFLKRIES